MADQSISVGLDVSEVLSEAKRYITAINTQNKAVEELAVTLGQFNKQGQARAAVVRGIIDSENELVVRLERTKKGFVAQSAAIAKNIEAVDRLTKARQKQNEQTSFVKKLGNISDLGLPTDVSVDSTKLKSLQAKIGDLSFSGGVKGGEIKKLFDEINAGTDKVEAGIRGKIQRSLREVVDLFKNARIEQQKLIQNANNDKQIRDAFPVPKNASVTQLRGYEIAIASVTKALEKGTITQQQFNKALEGAKKGSFTQDGKGSPGQAKLLSDLEQLTKIFGDNERAAKGFFLTTKDLFRISEATLFKNVLGSITAEFTDGIRQASSYQILISQIRTISQGNQLSFSEWSKEIRKVSDEFGLSQSDVAQAAYDAVSNQVVKGAEAFKFLASAAELARITQSSLTDTQNILASAINSYGLNVEDAEVLSAQLFKTVDLGRVKISELANTFGRTTFLGNALGVNLQEIEAGLATLTVQGVRTSDAETFLTNVFQKLLKPTEAMKRVFDDLGVSSGEAAVKTFGFAGVIQKLVSLAKTGNVDVSDLFNEIRGRKGFEGLTNFSGEFEKNIDKITNSIENYNQAKIIRAESPADFLSKEFNKIRNVFIDDIGQQLITGAAAIVKGIAPIAPSFADIFEVIKKGVLVVGLYQGSLVATRLASLSFAAGTTAQTTSLGLFTAATVGSTAAIGTFRSALLTSGLAGIVVGISAAVAELYLFQKGVEQLSDVSQRLQDRQDRTKQVDDPSAKLLQDQTKRFTDLKNQSDKTFQSILQGIARVDRNVGQSLDRTRSTTSEVTNALEIQFKAYEGNLTDGIARLRSVITDSQRSLDRSQKSLAKFKEESKDSIFEFQLQFATPAQQFDLTKNKIKELRQEADELFNTKQKKNEPLDQFSERLGVNAEEGRKKLVEARSLSVQNAKLEIELIKEFNKQQGIQDDIVVKSTFLQKELADIGQQKLALEKQLGVEVQKNLDLATSQKKLEETRVDRIKQAFDEFSKFAITDKDGQVKSQFKEKLSGKANPDLIEGDFQTKADALRKAIGPDANAQLELLQLVEKKKQSIVEESELIRTKAVIEGQRKRIESIKEESNTAITNLSKQLSTANKDTFGTEGTLETVKKLLPDIQKFIDIAKPGGGPFGEGGNVATDIAERKLAEIEIQAKAVKDNAIFKEGILTPKDEDLARLRELQNELTKALEFAFKLKGVTEFKSQTLPGSDVSLGRILDTGNVGITSSRNDLIKIQQLEADLANTRLQLKTLQEDPKVKQLQQQFPELAVEGVKANEQLQGGFTGTLNAVQKVNEAVETLKKNLNGLNFNGVNADLNEGGSQYFARGGIVPGSPRGTDTVGAWLTPGERVLTVNQNKKFSPILEAMGAFKPKYFSQGGNVTTNVGDVNINYNGSKGTNEADLITKVGKGLRRAVQQGRVKIS